ncbi:MAG: hypothetical protein QG632_448 [Candidatus Dependentiae bacterium]|nr:hypothetical protein [Candidatus Dependentiae bacterium]
MKKRLDWLYCQRTRENKMQRREKEPAMLSKGSTIPY